jgi:hypothetical protein
VVMGDVGAENSKKGIIRSDLGFKWVLNMYLTTYVFKDIIVP